MTKEWTAFKIEIERLYSIERLKLDAVRRVMSEKHGFEASIRSYKEKIKEWGWPTYNKSPHAGSDATIPRIRRHRPSPMAMNKTATLQRGIQMLQNELQRQMSLETQENATLVVAHRSPEAAMPNSEASRAIQKSVNKITKIEAIMVELKMYMKEILTASNSPAIQLSGFSACWKLEPMILEDALGTKVPLPVELLDSWEMFDRILEEHFKPLAGVRKVQRREYTIEDCLTRTELSREEPWSSFRKPGLRIEMSMVFRDFRKIAKVCPGCDTISTEQKGTFIECLNPECNMLFRAEEDEGVSEEEPGTNTQPSDLTAVGSGSGTWAHDDEDKPKQFKRVVIRLMRDFMLLQDLTYPNHPSYETQNSATPFNMDLSYVASIFEDDPILFQYSKASQYYQDTGAINIDNTQVMLEDEFMRDFTCCGEILTSFRDLLQHNEKCHLSSPLASSQGKESSLIDLNPLRPHLVQPYMYHCQVVYCNSYGFATKRDFVRHVARHERPYICKVAGCGFQAATNRDLNRHKLAHHDISSFDRPRNRYFCPVLGCKWGQKVRSAGFRRRDNLWRHIRNMHPEHCITVLEL